MTVAIVPAGAVNPLARIQCSVFETVKVGALFAEDFYCLQSMSMNDAQNKMRNKEKTLILKMFNINTKINLLKLKELLEG